MIYASIYSEMNLDLYGGVIKDAIGFFKKTDFSAYDTGEYELSGRDILFQVHDLKTKPAFLCKPEVHRQYVDVQFLFKGKETIGVACDKGNNEISEDLIEERDILFYKKVENETFVSMSEGDYCIFFPSDVHRPGCERSGCSDIRKIVYKISVDLLKMSLRKVNERS